MFADTPTIPDDLYHCKDPSQVDRRESIACDGETFLWNVDELDPNRPPRMCGNDFTIEPEEVPNVQDWFEPCVLWAIEYGNLKVTLSPSASPTISLEPTKKLLEGDDVDTEFSGPAAGDTSQNTGNDEGGAVGGESEENSGSGLPSQEQTEPPAEATEGKNTVMPLSPIVLTWVWDDQVWEESGGTLSVDRSELKVLTERHVLEALEAQIGPQSIRSISLEFTLGPPRVGQWTEAVGGEVEFADPSIVATLPATTLQALYQQAFLENALALYLFRLQLAEDPVLRLVEEVLPGAFGDGTLSGIKSEGDGTDDGDANLLLTIVSVIVSVTMVSLCLCVYFLFCRKPNKTYHNPRGSVIMVQDGVNKNIADEEKDAARLVDQIPTIPTKSSSMDNDDVYVDEENQASLSNFTMSELDDNSLSGFGGNVALMGMATGANVYNGKNATESDNQSVGTSVYSYYNDDQSLLGGGGAASVAFSVGDVNSRKNQNKKKKGILWSVMDTLQTHFGNDSDIESYDGGKDLTNSDLISPITSNSNDFMLGRNENDVDDNSANSRDLLYGDEDQVLSTATPAIIGSSSTGKADTVEDDGSDLVTPVKERLEQLWKTDDEVEAVQDGHGVKTPQMQINSNGNFLAQATLKKSNLSARGSGVKVFHDEEKDTSGDLNTSYESDDEPTAELLEGAGNRVQSAPPDADDVIVHASEGHLGDREKCYEEHRFEDEDDKGMVLPLPSQLLSVNNDSMSVSSHHSSQSSGSLGRKLFLTGGERGVAQKRNSWGHASDKSVSSVQSSDSAKYRSLLNQMDTNDAALFGLEGKEKEGTITAETLEEPESGANNSSQLSSLIQSFDKAWSEESEDKASEKADSNSEGSHSSKNTKDISVEENVIAQKRDQSSAIIDFSSDDEDVYLEDGDEAATSNPPAEELHDLSAQSTNSEKNPAQLEKEEARGNESTVPENHPVASQSHEGKETGEEQVEAHGTGDESAAPEAPLLTSQSHEGNDTTEEQEEIEVDVDDNVSIKSDSQNSAHGTSSASHELSALLVKEGEDGNEEIDEVGSFDGVEDKIPFENEDLQENMVFPDEVDHQKNGGDENKVSEDDDSVLEEHLDRLSREDYTDTMASF